MEQRLIPAEALSRVGAFNMVGAFAFGPVAFIAAGPEAALFGPRAVLAFGAAWSAVMTLAVLAVPAIRRCPGRNRRRQAGSLPGECRCGINGQPCAPGDSRAAGRCKTDSRVR